MPIAWSATLDLKLYSGSILWNIEYQREVGEGGGQLTSEGGDLLRSRMPGEAIYSGEDCTGVQVTPE